MTLRLAGPGDEPALLRMVISFFEASQYKDFGIAEDKIKELVLSLTTGNKKERLGICLVVDGKIVGVLGCAAFPNLFNHEIVCAELIWWIDPEHRSVAAAKELLDAYEYWATKVVKAQIIQLASLADDKAPAIARLYKRRGFIPAEHVFMKDVRCQL